MGVKRARLVGVWLVLCGLGWVALPGSASATFKGRNGRIAWAVFNAGGGGGGGFASLSTYNSAGRAHRQLGYCPEDNDANVCTNWQDVTYSPDGNQLLWNQSASSGEKVIVLAQANGSHPTVIDHEVADDTQASFAPNGRRIAYVRQPVGTGGQFGTLVTSDLTGSSVHVVSPSIQAAAPVFTPDGKHILFLREGRFSFPGGIWSISLRGQHQRRLIARASAFDVSPDGRSIAYLSRGGGDLYIARSDGTRARRLAHEPVSDLLSPAVRFSPDGKLIVFSAFGRKHMSGATIYRVGASGGMARVLSDSRDPRTVTTGLSWQPRR